MNLFMGILLKSNQPLSLVMRSTKRAAMWSRLAVGTLACAMVTLLLADRFTGALMLYASAALSVVSILLNTIATGAHGDAYLASRRAMKASQRYANAGLHRRVLLGLVLSWAAYSLAMAAVPIAALACSIPGLWVSASGAFGGCLLIAAYAERTRQMIADVEGVPPDGNFEVQM